MDVVGGPISLGSYLANFLLAVAAALFMPASNALVKERVLDGRLGRFNSRYEMGTNTGMLLASSSAGFLIVVFGATPLLVFNAFTFVASAILTWPSGPNRAVHRRRDGRRGRRGGGHRWRRRGGSRSSGSRCCTRPETPT